MVLPFCILYLFLCIRAEVINIQPTSKSCEDIQYHGTSTRNDTLQDGLDNISSNTVLILSPGCHYLNRFTPVMSKTNISIIGDGNSSDDIVITCESGVGVVFLNVSQLELKGLTFTQCNLTGQNLNKTLSNIQGMSIFSLVFDIPTSVEVTLLIANSIDVTIDKVYINDTHGYGFIAINVLESFVITSSVISNNYNRDCYYVDPSYYHGIGGGAIILYHDTKLPSTHSRLAITNTSFLYNSNCGYSTFSEIYAAYTDSFFLDNAQYVIGGGGGLTIYLIHHGYDVTLDISNCYFQNNTARFGGAIYVGVFIGVSNTTISIENSTFLRNGLIQSNISDPSYITTGQGMTIVTDISFPSSNNSTVPIGVNNYIIRNCNFTENVAFAAAAVLLYSRYITITPNLIPNTLLFDKCKFSKNKAYIGSALYLFEQKYSGVQLGLDVILKDIEVYNNVILTRGTGLLTSSTYGFNIIEILSVHVSLCGITQFANNNGTPIHARSSVLHIDGEAYFTNNTGALGGALGLTSGSFLIINKNSHVTFFRNQAFYYGGAIYTEYTGSEYAGNYFDCYLFFDKIDLECARFKNCIDPTTLNITVSFNLNQASTADVVYGSTLETCPWVDKLRTSCNSSSSVYDLLGECGIFQYTQNLSSQSLATPPYRISTSINTSSPLMPGQQLMVTMNAYDRFEQVVPDPITSSVIDNLAVGETKSVLGESGYWFIDRQKFHNVPVSIRSEYEPMQQEEIEVGIFSVTSSTAPAYITVNIRECYLGFEFDYNGSQNYKTCICTRLLQNRSDINCYADTATITVPNGKWVGNVSGNRLAVHSCVFNYCKVGGANITDGNFDVQCNEGFRRVGVLCGQCKEGYSIQFGTNECSKCSNYTIFFLIYFAAMGVALIGTIGRLGVTVAHGFLNSILFYSNIITPYQSYLILNSSYYSIMYSIVILNLDIGFPVCFYNGMTSLVRSYLHFVFPIYLWILMGIYTLLSRYQWWQRQWRNSNPAQVFASVMLMSFTSTLRACTAALSIIRLDNTDHPWRWAIDPSVVYFSPEHAPLGIISIIIILIYIIPAPLFLLFPPLTLRTPLGRKFLPIYDAFWAPFRPGYQFWVGLRLFLRLLPFIFALYVPNPLNILLLGIFAVFYLLAHIYFKPFKGEAQNFLDIYLTLNIILLAIGSLYFSLKINSAQSEDSVMNDEKNETVYISLVVFLAFIAFVCVYIYHLVLKYECLQNRLKSLKHKFRARFSKKKETSNIQSTDNSCSSDYSLTGKINSIPTPPTFSELREPLLEDISYDQRKT